MNDVFNVEVLNKLLVQFQEIKAREEQVSYSSKEYATSAKQLAHAEQVIEVIQMCLLLIEVEDMPELQKEYTKLMQLLVQQQTGNEVVIEIRAGAGGDESALFAQDMANMYLLYAELCNWNAYITACTQNEGNGYKNCTLKIKGKGAYGKLFLESGTHRVQRIPATETKGRIHTSTVNVYVYKETAEVKREPLHPQDLEITACRASGAGGQHVNTTDSAIRIVHIPTGIVAECQNERSQHSNKAKALEVLTERVHEAQRQKEHQSRNAERFNTIGTMDRSEKIRTYNYARNQVVDHRYHIESHNLTGMMQGRIDTFLEKIAIQHALMQIKAI
jgi:peptide chain release factor 1